MQLTQAQERITSLEKCLQKSQSEAAEQHKLNAELLKMGTSLTITWALNLSDENCRSFTGLPIAGLNKLLTLCSACGIADVFAPPRFYQVKPGVKRKVSGEAAPIPSLSACTPRPSLSWEDQLLMFLVRVKCDLGERQLAALFHVSQPRVSTIIDDMAALLYDILSKTLGNFRRSVPPENRLKCFGPDTPFGDVSHIADCTLIRANKPRNHVLQNLLYSTYLPGHKLKALVSMAADGYPNYVSALYASSASDHDVALQDGFYEALAPDDEVMFDKGGASMLPSIMAKGAKLIMPSFVVKRHLTLGEYKHSRMVSSARVHIERLNERIKRFRWLDGVITTSSFSNVSKIWSVCVWLTNFMGPPCKDGGSGLPHNRLAAAVPRFAAGRDAAEPEPESVDDFLQVLDGDEERNFDPIITDDEMDESA